MKALASLGERRDSIVVLAAPVGPQWKSHQSDVPDVIYAPHSLNLPLGLVTELGVNKAHQLVDHEPFLNPLMAVFSMIVSSVALYILYSTKRDSGNWVHALRCTTKEAVARSFRPQGCSGSLSQLSAWAS